MGSLFWKYCNFRKKSSTCHICSESQENSAWTRL